MMYVFNWVLPTSRIYILDLDILRLFFYIGI